MDGTRLTAAQQRRLSDTMRHAHDARLYRRTLAVLECGRGKGVVEVARTLGVTRQSVYNWVRRYQHAGKPTSLADAPRTGRPRQAHGAAETLLQVLIMASPEQCGYHATYWTVPLLLDQVRQNLGTACCDTTIRRSLHRLGYVWKRPRYVLAADPQREKKKPYPARAWQLTSAKRGVGGG